MNTYTKNTYSLFKPGTVTYYRHGRPFVTKFPDGRIQFKKAYTAPVEITRAQAYKYWHKHFQGRICYALPQALQNALEKPCVSFGEYINHSGEKVSYAG